MSREVEIEEIITWPELSEVRAELADPRIAKTHGKRGTYASGCRGPLCRRANTLDIRKYASARRRAEGVKERKPYDREEYPMAELLDAIIEWHTQQRTLIKALNKVTTQEVRKAG